MTHANETAPLETAPLGTLIELYILGRVGRQEIGRATGRDDRFVLLDFARSVDGRDVSSLTADEVRAWLDGMTAAARNTRRDRLAVLRRFYAELVSARVVERDPTRAVSVGPAAPPAPRRRGPVGAAPPDIAAEYLLHLRRRGFRDSTVEARAHALTRLARHLGEVSLLEATYPQLLGFVDRLALSSVEGRCSAIFTLRTFYRWALIEGVIGDDPTLKLIAPRRPARLPRPMPDRDVALALREATDAPLRQWLHLAAFCGLRAMEIAQVRHDELVDTPSGTTLVVTNGKGGKSRAIPVPLEVMATLDDAQLPRVGWLFPRVDPPAGPVSAGQVSKRCNGFLHELGIAHTLHSLRHFFGTKLYELTQDLRLVQELMGHASPVVTSRYTRLNVDEHAAAVRSMTALWCARSLGDVPSRAS